jgi:hypothetical protein
MRGYRLRIALLSLGVLFGYGSAVAHFTHRHYNRHHGHHDDTCEHDFGWGHMNSDHPPAKPVQ